MLLVLNMRGGPNHDSVFTFAEQVRYEDINGNPMPWAEVRRVVSQGQGCVYVHGYNVTEARDAYARIWTNVGHLYAWTLLVLWPGSKVKIGFWPAERRSDMAGLLLRDVFALLPGLPPDVESHSCGCRLGLEAVLAGMKVRHLILAAAAVDNEKVHMDGRYGAAIAANCASCMVAHSRNDAVLAKAFRLSSWLKRAARLRFWGDDCKALGYTGPQDIGQCPANLKAVNLNGAIHRHGAYKESEAFFDAWRGLAS
mgnify:FL=1